MFVKVCGLTNLDDAQAAVDAGAGALGFIFHSLSPRFVEPKDWIAKLPSNVWKVGVFVDRPRVKVERAARDLGLDVAQLHGTEMPEDFPQGVRVWKAFRVMGEIDQGLNDYPVEAILLDGPGCGRSFDWPVASAVTKQLVLAGGLDEHNVAEAIEQVRPWGIDVCSSIERSPGKKDRARMARFIKACQSALSLRA